MEEGKHSCDILNHNKKIPHGIDVYKEDLDGELWWLQDNDYLYRGYRTKLSFWEAFKSFFRSTNETINIWTHFIGACLFIFLIYVTYAIPVENLFTLRQDVALYQCLSKGYHDILDDSFYTNATCTDAVSRDISLADEFSNLFYYLSSTNKTYSLSLGEESHSFFSWLSTNTSITHDVVHSIRESVHSLYHHLLSLIHSHPESSDKGLIEKSVNVVEVLKNDLTEFDHKVVGHVPRWPIIVFIACAIWCLAGSAIYHHFYCCNYMLSQVLQTLDYCGISILISGSYVPVIYYGFYCYPDALRFHLITVIILNVINVSVMATPTFRQPKYRAVRAIAFTVVSCYAFISLIHIYFLDGWSNPIFSVMKWYITGMGGTYILGAILYGTRFPEKYWPGAFDYVFASHQLFHVCIVIAALFHYVGSYQMYCYMRLSLVFYKHTLTLTLLCKFPHSSGLLQRFISIGNTLLTLTQIGTVRD